MTIKPLSGRGQLVWVR